MPVMNGFDAAGVLKRLMPTVPLIMYSAFGDKLAEKQARLIGISEVLHQDRAECGDRGDEAVGRENCLCSRCAAGFGELIRKLLKIWSRRPELNW